MNKTPKSRMSKKNSVSKKSSTNENLFEQRDSYDALEDKNLFPSNSRDDNISEKPLDPIYDKYYDIESKELSVPSNESVVQNFEEEKILEEGFDYKFNKTNPFYRKLNLEYYTLKKTKEDNFKQFI